MKGVNVMMRYEMKKSWLDEENKKYPCVVDNQGCAWEYEDEDDLNKVLELLNSCQDKIVYYV